MENLINIKKKYVKGKKFFLRNPESVKTAVYDRFEAQVLTPQDALYIELYPEILDEVNEVKSIFGGHVVGVVELDPEKRKKPSTKNRK